jgi:hypothetical protein
VSDLSALVVLHEGADASAAREWFAARGLDVGPLVGISFSIAGPPQRVRELFPDYDDHTGGGGELALDRVAPEVRPAVRAVALSAPPEYGPGNP